jgi:hypothetical protein
MQDNVQEKDRGFPDFQGEKGPAVIYVLECHLFNSHHQTAIAMQQAAQFRMLILSSHHRKLLFLSS